MRVRTRGEDAGEDEGNARGRRRLAFSFCSRVREGGVCDGKRKRAE
jgi:hypothetical protein